MRVLIILILCLFLLEALEGSEKERTCWPCWDCLMDCKRDDGKECCEEAKKECCKDCDMFKTHYQMCLERVDSEESYIEHRTKSKLDKWRQQFEDELK